MSFSYSKLQEVLVRWPSPQLPHESDGDSILERIRQVLVTFEVTGNLQKSDLKPLIRHLLLRESINSGTSANLRVPASFPWPTAEEWSLNGISAMVVSSNAYLLSALPWCPEWLGADEAGVFADSFSRNIVREDGRCSADPFISDATGYAHYSSSGQREAIRGAFLIPPGSTLIVNLPTGSGKSLVGQTPALVHHQDGHLTLFVVPTVSLAIDQARQMESYFRKSSTFSHAWPLAWYSGISDADRSEIRRRMREGTQKILFISPEALTTSLLRIVFEVAANGMLRYLVIDEAHLVTQWGDEFRPAFQALAGMRNSLLREAKQKGIVPFRTLLLSATFAPDTTDTLANLFGPPERVQMVAAVHLRPEPQYWFSRVTSSAEKSEHVLEALRHAPRPFILYVTKREDSATWFRILTQSAGYKRVRLFDGGTSGLNRKEIIDEWNKNKLDGIVATSAFGVGIDKDDVRTIIHATIPETLDRLYQEVGRGGRDGRSSNSLLVYENADWTLSKNMANPVIISNELGLSRWRALYESRNNYKNDGNLFRVDPNAIRQGLMGSNDENIKWNMRTLLLMSRAGFIELDVEPSSEGESNEDDLDVSPLAAMSAIRIRVLRHDHLLSDAWDNVISLSRNNTLSAGTRNLRLMQHLLQDGGEMSETLAKLYRSTSQRWPVDVTTVCGGCPVDRFSDARHNQYHVPIARPVHEILQADLSNWKSTFPHLDPKYVAVFYEPGISESTIVRLFKWLVSQCWVQEVCVDGNATIANSIGWRQLYRHAPSGVVVHRNLEQLDEEPYSPLARCTLFHGKVKAQDINRILQMDRPMHVVLFPSDTCDPDHPGRLLSDTAMNSARLEQIIEVINQ